MMCPETAHMNEFGCLNKYWLTATYTHKHILIRSLIFLSKCLAVFVISPYHHPCSCPTPQISSLSFMKRADLRHLHSTVFTFIHIWIQNGWRDLTVFKDTVMYYGNCSSAHWHIVTSNFASVLVWSLADSAVSGPLLYWLSCTMLFVIYKGDEEEDGDKPCKPAHTHTCNLSISLLSHTFWLKYTHTYTYHICVHTLKRRLIVASGDRNTA